MTEIRIAITPETLALLEMSMSEGDTYDAVIMRLMKTPWTKTKDGWECEKRWIQRTKGMDFTLTLPEGLSIDPGAITKLEAVIDDDVAYCRRCDLPNDQLNSLAIAAHHIREDIARTVDLKALTEFEQSRIDRFRESAVSVIMKTENVVALNEAVKAVFDE